MKILAPIKRVIDPYAKVGIASDGTSIDSGSSKFEINPFDEIAMEEAVRIKEKDPSTQIVAVSIGPAPAEEQLRKALAMGADRAVLIESNEQWDPSAVAKELAAFVRSEPFDLVLMGKQATDDDSNQVAQMLAALLDWPQATFASKVELGQDACRVTRETDTGEQVVELKLPCVISADLRLNQPRYIALPGIIKARSKPLEKRPPSTTPSPRCKNLELRLPPKRDPGRKFSTVEQLAAAILAKGVLR